MRVSISFTFALAISLSCIANTSSPQAKMLSCERYSEIGIRDETSQRKYDSKYPTHVIVDVNVFKAASR